jgi:hypothetical protein
MGTERHAVRLQLLATRSFIETVDCWRAQQSDLPNRSEAIRRLVLQRLTSLEPAEPPV